MRIVSILLSPIREIVWLQQQSPLTILPWTRVIHPKVSLQLFETDEASPVHNIVVSFLRAPSTQESATFLDSA